MAEQVPSDVASMAGHGPGAGRHGRPISWVAVSMIMLGFVLGGTGLMTGPAWWLFWAGTGLAAVGGILALGSGIFNDWY